MSNTNKWNSIYSKCNSGTNKDKYANLIDFPRFLDVELTNTCNLNCIMCPTGMNISQRKQGFMSHGTFEKILTECIRHRCHIRFVRWGEPLLHPELTRFIGLIKGTGLMCHINTNGMFIDDEFIIKIIRLKLDSIKFSFQGVDKNEYEKYRQGAEWEKLILNIKRLHDYRGRKKLPFITIGTTVTQSTSNDNIINFKSKMSEISDRVDIGITRNIINPPTLSTTNHPSCPEMFDKLSVNWDGTVTACCSDWNNTLLVGDLRHSTLEDIWKGDNMDYYRKMIVNNRHSELVPCNNCYL